MNAYDFDKTIFDGDSTARFYKYCLLRTPKMFLRLPRLALEAVFLLPKNKQRFKENMFGFLRDLKNPEKMLDDFWKKNGSRIKKFYLAKKREDDLIASASPEFLLRPILATLGITRLIASPVDFHTGKYSGPNCHGQEKVIRFFDEFPGETIDNFYSDSHSDDPMADIAKNAHLVRGEKIMGWNEK